MTDIKRSEMAGKSLVALLPPPPRFTINDWYLHNRQRYRLAEDQSLLAERLMEESERVRESVDETIRRNKEATDMRLKERIGDIQFMKEEIEEARANIQRELEALGLYKERIQDGIKSIKSNALGIVQKCVILRDGRLGIDLSHDDVEKELLKEIKTIEGAEMILQRALEQVNELMRELRATLYLLNRDVEDKLKVLSIEKDCLNLKETSLSLSVYHGTTPLDVANITLKEWERFTEDVLIKGQQNVNNGRLFRTYVDTLLHEVVVDLTTQYKTTNEAFLRRIEEVKEAKTKLEQQHFEIARQANEMTRNITELEKEIAQKESYLALAHTRLGRRAHRPQVELVRDEVETRLVNEVVEIRKLVAQLQQMMAESQANLRYLLKTQVQLEEDINIKINSLKIDEVDCMSIRQGIDFQPF